MKKVNIGIAGLGLAGYQLHAQAYARIENVNIHSLCTRDETKLQRIAHEFKVDKMYTNYDDFLQDDTLDAVSICVTDAHHYQYARKAVEAGKHLICEKPLGTTLDEVQNLSAMMHNRKTKFAVGQVYRFVPQFTTMKNLLESGRLGRLFHIDCDYQQDMRELYKNTPWRRNDKTWNSWVAGGAHVVDLVRYLGGDIDEIMMYANKGEEDPDCGPLQDNHLSIMKFKSGATCKVWEVRCIKRAPEFTINLSLYGSRGTAIGSLINNEVRVFSLDDGEKQSAFGSIYTEKVDGIPIQLELEDFIASILEDRPPRCDVVSGAQTIAAVLAGVEAQEKGRPVKVAKIV
jgi:UDP-N-acetylglucosamine 3-dehydrogenase